MIYFSLSDSINNLPLSVRVRNCLRRSALTTLKDMLDYPQNKWREIVTLGKDSENEILQFLENLESGNAGYSLTPQDSAILSIMRKNATKESSANIDDILPDMHIERLNLSTRTYNVLRRAGIVYVSDLLQMPFEDLQKLPNAGLKVEEELRAALNDIKTKAQNKTNYSNKKANIVHTHIISQINEKLVLSPLIDINTLALNIEKDHPECDDKQFAHLIFTHILLHEALKETILSIVKNSDEGITFEDIIKKLPDMIDTEIIESLLLELKNTNKILLSGEKIHKSYTSVYDYIQQIPNLKCKQFINEFMTAENPADAGNKLKEADRKQLLYLAKRYLDNSKTPEFKEKKYYDVYEKYSISEEQFTECFEENICTYRYLMLIGEKKRFAKKPFSEIVSDDMLPLQIKERAERINNKDLLFFNGHKIQKRRAELLHYFFQNNCRSATRVETILENYSLWLKSIGLYDDAFMLNMRSYEGHLNDSNFCLLSYPKKYRYYDVCGRDYSKLLSTINLMQYNNVEISTLKFFNENTAIMIEYDIRDEYELYSLLKKIVSRSSDKNFVFKKMPTIEIGVVDRDKQLYDLFIKNDPITAEDLARKYELEYGVKANVVRANYLESLKKYYKNGLYVRPMK